MSAKPNIVFITSDQHRGDCYGFEGRKIKTPFLDGLAGQGTRFTACITPNVLCQPARASMLTGLYPRTHGVVDNGFDLQERFAEQGYAASCLDEHFQAETWGLDREAEQRRAALKADIEAAARFFVLLRG